MSPKRGLCGPRGATARGPTLHLVRGGSRIPTRDDDHVTAAGRSFPSPSAARLS